MVFFLQWKAAYIAESTVFNKIDTVNLSKKKKVHMVIRHYIPSFLFATALKSDSIQIHR